MRSNLDYHTLHSHLMQDPDGSTARIITWPEGIHIRYDKSRQRLIRCDGESESDYVLNFDDMNSTEWELTDLTKTP